MANPRKHTAKDPAMMTRLFNNLILTARLLLDRRVGMGTKFIPLLAVAYILSPIDLIPDFLLPFGVFDDLGALLLGLQMFINNAPKDIVEQYRRQIRVPNLNMDMDETRRYETDDDPDIIDGYYEVRED